jgi:hypothetical protein
VEYGRTADMNEGMKVKLNELLDAHASAHPDNAKTLGRDEFLQIVNILNHHARTPYRSVTVELSRKIKLKTHLISELEKMGYIVLE